MNIVPLSHNVHNKLWDVINNTDDNVFVFIDETFPQEGPVEMTMELEEDTEVDKKSKTDNVVMKWCGDIAEYAKKGYNSTSLAYAKEMFQAIFSYAQSITQTIANT